MFWNFMLSVKSVQSRNKQRKRVIHPIAHGSESKNQELKRKQDIGKKNGSISATGSCMKSDDQKQCLSQTYDDTSQVNWDMMKLLPPDGQVAVILSLHGPPTPYTHTPSQPCTPHLTPLPARAMKPEWANIAVQCSRARYANMTVTVFPATYGPAPSSVSQAGDDAVKNSAERAVKYRAD